MLLDRLKGNGLISPPSFLVDNVCYLVISGSTAYGCGSNDADWDIYGFCVPPKEIVFPHLDGQVIGFGTQIKRFEQWSEHHIVDKEKRRNYDFAVYSIVKYFQLCMDNNPNMVDSLFVPDNCVLHCNKIGELVRKNRQLFLHKGCYHKFKGYAYSQLHKMETKSPEAGSKRKAVVEEFGFDVKFGMHLIRLLDECEQILETCNLDLQRSKEVLKSVRRGEWSAERIKDYFYSKEPYLEKLYQSSSLPYKADEDSLRELLLECLNRYYAW